MVKVSSLSLKKYFMAAADDFTYKWRWRKLFRGVSVITTPHLTQCYHTTDKLQTQTSRPKPHVHYTVTERRLAIESSVPRTHREGMGEIQIRDQCTYSAPQYIFATQSTLHVPTDVPAFIILIILLATTGICVLKGGRVMPAKPGARIGRFLPYCTIVSHMGLLFSQKYYD